MRHTFASHFMMSGGKVYDLQKLLGHSTIAMTERYSHLSPDHLRGKTDIIEFGKWTEAAVIPLRRVDHASN
jgi:site-specific recombinase XerD